MMNRLALIPALFPLTLLIACGGGGGSSPNKAAAEAPPPPLAESYTFSSEDLVPANITFDPVDRAFYAASRNGGSIVRIDADGGESTFREADDRTSSIGGIKVDADARLLWACVAKVDGIDDRIWVFDLDTGERTMEFLLAALYTDGSCHDLVLDRAGVAYVVDGANPTIYRLDPVSEEGEVYLVDPLLDGAGAPFGPNGIAITADGTTLIIGTFLSGQLTHVSLPEPDRVFPIALEGDELSFPDGLAMFEGDLYSTTTDAISRVRFAEDFSSGTVVTRAQSGGISSATVAEGALYAVKSETFAFVAGTQLDLPFLIFRVDVAAYE